MSADSRALRSSRTVRPLSRTSRPWKAAAGPLLANVLPYHPFLIKPNHDELGELCGTVLSPDDTEAIARCARSLQERGARNVLVSMGGSGALLVTEDGPSFHQDVARGELVN